MRISDWSSDVCSSDLVAPGLRLFQRLEDGVPGVVVDRVRGLDDGDPRPRLRPRRKPEPRRQLAHLVDHDLRALLGRRRPQLPFVADQQQVGVRTVAIRVCQRSEEHTSELQSLMRISYAVFCLKKKNKRQNAEQTTKTKVIRKI